MKQLAAAKCVGLFAGLESLDLDLLRRYGKTQNLSKRFNIIEDSPVRREPGPADLLWLPVRSAASDRGRYGTPDEDDRGRSRMPMPVYLSVVAPLAGTKCFWEDLADGDLAPNLRLRDLDGETLCYANFADDPTRLASFVERLFRRPWTIVSRRKIFTKSIRRIVIAGTFNPVRWVVIASANCTARLVEWHAVATTLLHCRAGHTRSTI